MSPWRFAAPLAPDMAAAREGRALDFDRPDRVCRHAIDARTDVLLIEGIGGIMVPLDERHTVLDWMVALRLPVLLVAGSYLGTISHTLTAVRCAAAPRIGHRRDRRQRSAGQHRAARRNNSHPFPFHRPHPRDRHSAWIRHDGVIRHVGQTRRLTLFDLDARFLDERPPLVHFGLQESSQLVGRRADHEQAELLQP